jgi:hypothetical protein
MAVPKTIKALLCPDQDQQSAVLQTKNPSLAGHDIEVLSQCGRGPRACRSTEVLSQANNAKTAKTTAR